MLYLIAPDAPLRWSDLPASVAFGTAAQPGADLAQLDWQVSERPVDDAAVRLAIRYGVPCSEGLVVDANLIAAQDQAALVRHARAAADGESTPKSGWIEGRFLRWTAGDHETASTVARSSERVASAVTSRAAEAVGAEPDAALMDHWTALLGRLPVPL